MANFRPEAALCVLCCIAIVPLLSSCGLGDPSYTINPTTISRDGGSLMIAVCTDANVTDVRVEGRGFPANWKELLVAKGNAELKAGDIFSTDDSIPGLTASTATMPDFDKTNQFMVVLSNSDSKSQVSTAGFDAPDGGLPEGKWLHWDGEVTEQPCPG